MLIPPNPKGIGYPEHFYMKKTILMLCILLLPLAYALELDDTLIESIGLNTSIQVNETIYFDLFDINESYIYIENFTYTSGSEYLISDINITESNARYYYNSTSKDLPYISSTSSSSKTLTTSIGANVTVVLDIPCTTRTISSIVYTDANSVTTTYIAPYTECSSAQITYDLELIAGDNIITINYPTDAELYTGCRSISNTVTVALILILVAIIAGAAIMLVAIANGGGEPGMIIGILVTAIALAIIVIIGIFINYKISAAVCL